MSWDCLLVGWFVPSAARVGVPHLVMDPCAIPSQLPSASSHSTFFSPHRIPKHPSSLHVSPIPSGIADRLLTLTKPLRQTKYVYRTQGSRSRAIFRALLVSAETGPRKCAYQAIDDLLYQYIQVCLCNGRFCLSAAGRQRLNASFHLSGPGDLHSI